MFPSPVTNTKLVPLLGEHDPDHLGEDAPGSVSDHLGVVTPLPERHRAILSTTDVELGGGGEPENICVIGSAYFGRALTSSLVTVARYVFILY